MLALIKRMFQLLISAKTSSPVPSGGDQYTLLAETLAMHHAAVANLQQQFDEMKDAEQVKEWFRSKTGFFFTEWPRGMTPLSRAIEGAKCSRFGEELADFLAQLEAHWYEPSKVHHP